MLAFGDFSFTINGLIYEKINLFFICVFNDYTSL